MITKIKNLFGDKPAIIIFFSCFIFYMTIGGILALKTNIIDNSIDVAGWDAYFSYDNPYYVHSIFEYYSPEKEGLRHPYFKLIFFPVIVIAKIANMVSFKLKTLFLILLTNFSVSLSIVFVYKYIDKVVRIRSKLRKSLIVILYALFANNIIVSFTPESYPFSLLFLTLIYYYYSLIMIEQRDISAVKVSILTALCTGITITNGAKCLIPILFLRKSFARKAKLVLGICIAVGICLSVYLISLEAYSFYAREVHSLKYSPVLDPKGMFEKLIFYFRDYTNTEVTLYRINDVFIVPWFQAFTSYFFGFPLIFGEFVNIPLRTLQNWNEINSLPFTKPIHYVVVSSFLALMVTSLIRNRGNRLVLMLAACFGFDVILHTILKLGLYESTIYGSHWIFVVPWFIGWLYASLAEKNQRYLDVLVAALLVFTLVNNMSAIREFIDLAVSFYPAS